MKGCLRTTFTIIGGIVVLIFGLIILASLVNRPQQQSASTRSIAAQTTTQANGPTPTPTMTVDEIKAKAVTLEFKDLYRNIEQHVGKVLHTTGKVVQARQDSKGGLFTESVKYTILRVEITKREYGAWEDAVWVEYYGENRILENDIIEFWATVEGLQQYQAIMGNQVELPKLTAHIVNLIEE